MWVKQAQYAPRRVAELMYWDALSTPGILVQKDGSLLATLAYRGPDLYSAVDSQLVVQAARLNNLFMRFGGGWGLYSEARRRDVHRYPVSQWPDPVSRFIDAEREAYFTTSGRHYETETFLTLVYKPPVNLLPGWQGLLYEHLPQDTTEAETLATFEEHVARTQALLRDCCPEKPIRLVGTALLTYLHGTVSMKHHTVAVPDPACYLDTYLTDTDLDMVWRLPSLVKWPRLGEQWLRCISVKAYPPTSCPGMLDALEGLPIEYRACVRFLPLDRQKAIREIRKYRKAHYGQRVSGSAALAEKMGGDSADLLEQAPLEDADEASRAQSAVQHSRVAFGALTQTVVVWDTDFTKATAKAQLVEQTLNQADFTAKVESVNTLDAWAGTLPGNSYANVRQPLLHTQNLAHLLPATTPWPGPRRNAHLNGSPHMTVTGRGHGLYSLDLYHNDVAHTAVVGPTGSGKSTLVAILAAQWLKYANAQVYAIDIGQSLRCMTHAVGGDWFDVTTEIMRSFHGSGSLDDVAFQGGVSPWTPAYNRWQCFEMETLLDDDDFAPLVPGVLRTLFRTIEARLTGAPTLLIFDEAWRYLGDPQFAKRLNKWLRALRKKNGVALFATQSLAEMAESSIAAAINESCMSRIFLANERALEPTIGKLYDGYGLNQRHRQIIASLTPQREYYYQGMRGARTIDLALGPVALTFAGMSRPHELQLIAELYQGNGPQFAVDLLHARRLHAEADKLNSTILEKDMTCVPA